VGWKPRILVSRREESEEPNINQGRMAEAFEKGQGMRGEGGKTGRIIL
jgi:hypothetical protein